MTTPGDYFNVRGLKTHVGPSPLEVATCPVCKSICREPKTLPCLHTYCEACVQTPMACVACGDTRSKTATLAMLPTLAFTERICAWLSRRYAGNFDDRLSCSVCGGKSQLYCLDCNTCICTAEKPAHKGHAACLIEHSFPITRGEKWWWRKRERCCRTREGRAISYETHANAEVARGRLANSMRKLGLRFEETWKIGAGLAAALSTHQKLVESDQPIDIKVRISKDWVVHYGSDWRPGCLELLREVKLCLGLWLWPLMLADVIHAQASDDEVLDSVDRVVHSIDYYLNDGKFRNFRGRGHMLLGI